VFVALGLRGLVHALVGDAAALAAAPAAGLSTDVLAAAAAAAFLALHRRYGLFVESADMVASTRRATRPRSRRRGRWLRSTRSCDASTSSRASSWPWSATSCGRRSRPSSATAGCSCARSTLTPKQREHQEAILRSAQRLTELINDLLDVARREAARVRLDTRPTDVRQALEHGLATVQVAAQAERITISDELGPGLPLVQADRSRLHRILANLIGNAIKFTPAGGHVRVRGGRQKGQVWIAVEDTGVGIPPEELGRIWDPFYQVESALRRRHAGSGLRLAIVRRLVELHGGAVRAESAGENRGSRFTFTLPVAEAAAPAAAVAAECAVQPLGPRARPSPSGGNGSSRRSRGRCRTA
jgi:signal transduction histidine kinase